MWSCGWGWCARALGLVVRLSRKILGKSWEILEPVAKFWESSAGNSGIFVSDGIIHRCTNHDPRRGGISVTCLKRMHAAAQAKKGAGDHERATNKDQQRGAKGGCQTRVPETARWTSVPEQPRGPREGRDRAGEPLPTYPSLSCCSGGQIGEEEKGRTEKGSYPTWSVGQLVGSEVVSGGRNRACLSLTKNP